MPEQTGPMIAGAPETSESEEMYLLTILRAVENGHDGPVGLALLAERLGVSAASANEMIRKMEGRGLVAYEPYRGASLTSSGGDVASRVLRNRRLWARFLTERLGMGAGEADAMACDLEHVTTPDAAERLAGYLGRLDPGSRGGPAPDAGRPAAVSPLAALPAGSAGTVAAVEADGAVAAFLAAAGVAPGSAIAVAATGAAGVLASTSRGPLHLDPETAASVLVVLPGDRDAG